MEKINNYIGWGIVTIGLLMILQINNINPIKLVNFKSDSETASRVKTHLQLMSDSLIEAEKSRDHEAALQVVVAVTKTLDEFNALSEESKNKILTTELRSCHMASIYLADAAMSVVNIGSWPNKDKFFNASAMCH